MTAETNAVSPPHDHDDDDDDVSLRNEGPPPNTVQTDLKVCFLLTILAV